MKQQNESEKLKIFDELSDVFPSLIPLKGKIPIEKDWTLYCEETRFFNRREFKGCNCGIPTGPANSIIALDIDNNELFEKWLKAQGFKINLVTRVHQTGSGKRHYFYQYPANGKRYGNRSVKAGGFDVRGVGGQVVAPGSVHPDTGKPYRVLFDLKIAEAPEWLLHLSFQEQTMLQQHDAPKNDETIDLEALQIPTSIRAHIINGVPKGQRSEIIASVLSALIRAKVSDQVIFQVFDQYPIGDKYREKARNKTKWLQGEITRLKGFTEKNGRKTETVKVDVAARVRSFLIDEFDGGTFKISDLKRELCLSDKAYTVARNCVRRMLQQGLIHKHGHQLGCYRVVDRKKDEIEWDAVEAKSSGLILPFRLNDIAIIRRGDMICFAGFKNHNKSGMAIETIKLNLDRFKVHFFITEYKDRMKARLVNFGIDLNHPNFKTYPISQSDYIPDKIESGEGVLNVIDHWPNYENFFMMGKWQDDVHRALDGAMCLITHQKKAEDDLDAIGGSSWLNTPTLAVTSLPDGQHGHMLKIRKVKEPAEGIFNPYAMKLKYKLTRGCKFEYDPNGWK